MVLGVLSRTTFSSPGPNVDKSHMSANPSYARIGAIAAIAVAAAASVHWLRDAKPGTPPSVALEPRGVGPEDARFGPMSEVDALSLRSHATLRTARRRRGCTRFRTTRRAARSRSGRANKLHGRTCRGTRYRPARTRCPGRHLDNDLHWHSGDVIGPITFCVLVSDRAAARTRQCTMQSHAAGRERRVPAARRCSAPTRPTGGMDVRSRHQSTVPRRTVPRRRSALQRFQHDGVMHELRPGLFASTLAAAGPRVQRLTDGPLLDRVREELEPRTRPDPRPVASAYDAALTKRIALSAAITAIDARVSTVALPMCGSTTTFGNAASPSTIAGSFSNTSRPAPAI